MSYQALARKWRPQSFSEVVGQEHVISALSNALDSQKVHHAFLFTGTRGVGKTTLARIFAKAINCEQGVSSTPCGTCSACVSVDEGRFVDLIEVDAASRTKVDDTRELLDNVQYAPSMGRYKVYLIDEVHMLSGHSFNALLKTLEEPPEHVKFLLATTDPQKLPTTILSRCIQFNLKAMDIGRISSQLEKILDAENVKYEPGAILILARSANGSVRDALSLLDQSIAFGNGTVNTQDVRTMLGMIDITYTETLLGQILQQDRSGLLETVSAMVERSVEFVTAIDELLSLIHNIALYQVNPQAVDWKGIDTASISTLADNADTEILQLLYQIALLGKRDLSLAPDPRTGFEMTLLRMVDFQPGMPSDGTSTQVNRKVVRHSESTGSTQNAPDSRQAESPQAKSTQTEHNSTGTKPKLETQQKTGLSAIDSDIEEAAANIKFVEVIDHASNGQIESDGRQKQVGQEDSRLLTGKTSNHAVSGQPDMESKKDQKGLYTDDLSKNSLLKNLPWDSPKFDQAELKNPDASVNSGIASNNQAQQNVSEQGDNQYDTEMQPEINGTAMDKIELSHLPHPGIWASLIPQLDLTGMTKELAMHTVPVSVAGQSINMKVDELCKHLYSVARIKKIQAQCTDYFGVSIHIEAEVEALDMNNHETPAMQRERQARERQNAAEQAFNHDPNVQDLIDRFDAEILTNSIQQPGQ